MEAVKELVNTYCDITSACTAARDPAETRKQRQVCAPIVAMIFVGTPPILVQNPEQIFHRSNRPLRNYFMVECFYLSRPLLKPRGVVPVRIIFYCY